MQLLNYSGQLIPNFTNTDISFSLAQLTSFDIAQLNFHMVYTLKMIKANFDYENDD